MKKKTAKKKIAKKIAAPAASFRTVLKGGLVLEDKGTHKLSPVSILVQSGGRGKTVRIMLSAKKPHVLDGGSTVVVLEDMIAEIKRQVGHRDFSAHL